MEVQSDTNNTTETTQTFRGRVKWFNSTRGYGFITNLDKDEDTFVHHSGIHPSTECWKTLTPGEYVEYTLDTDDKGKSQASHVTGIAGGPLLCETNTRRQTEDDDGDESGSTRTRRTFRRNHRRQQKSQDQSSGTTETDTTS